MYREVGKLKQEIERIENAIEWNREKIRLGSSITYHSRCIGELNETIGKKEAKIKELELWWETA